MRHWHTVLAAALLCAGCRSEPIAPRTAPPVDAAVHARQALLDGPSDSQEVIAAAPLAAGSPLGSWTMPMADDCRIEMDIEPSRIRFTAYLKNNARLVFEGEYTQTGDTLSGVMTSVHIESPNMSIQSEQSKSFDLSYVCGPDTLTVTRFKGGGWDEQGEENFRGRYQRTAYRSVRETRSAPLPPPGREVETVTTGRPGENLRIESRSQRSTSYYEDNGDKQRIGCEFKLFGKN